LYWECQTRTTSQDCQLMLQRNLHFGVIRSGTISRKEARDTQLYNRWYMMVAATPCVSSPKTMTNSLRHRAGNGTTKANSWPVPSRVVGETSTQRSPLAGRRHKANLPLSGPRTPSWPWAALNGPTSYEICVKDGDMLEFGRCPYLGGGTLPRRQPHSCENSASSAFSLSFYMHHRVN
jgi:hypothetical protein